MPLPQTPVEPGNLTISISHSAVFRHNEKRRPLQYWTFRGSIHSLALQPDGKIVVGGTIKLGGSNSFLVTRLTSSGFLDQGFGVNGTAIVSMGTDTMGSVAVAPDGKIVLAGTSRVTENLQTYGGTKFSVARLTSNGGIDIEFGSAGIAQTDLGQFASQTPADDFGQSMLVQPDGKIVVAGYSFVETGSPQLALAKYETTGETDKTFGTNGVVITPAEPVLSAESFIREGNVSLDLQADGKLVVGATIQQSIDGGNFFTDFLAARYENSVGPAQVPSTDSDNEIKVTKVLCTPSGPIMFGLRNGKTVLLKKEDGVIIEKNAQTITDDIPTTIATVDEFESIFDPYADTCE